MQEIAQHHKVLPADLVLRNKHKITWIFSYVECRDGNKDMKVHEGLLGNRKENRKLRLQWEIRSMKYHNKTHCSAYTNKDLKKIKETKEKAGNK